MADLHLKLEQAKILGTNSLLTTALRHDYLLKKEALFKVAQMEKQTGAPEIQAQFAEAILRLQNKATRKKTKAPQGGRLTSDLYRSDRPAYKMDSSRPFPSTDYFFKYIDALDSILYNENHELIKQDLTGPPENLGPASYINPYIDKDRMHAWILRDSRVLEKIDLTHGAVVKSVPLEVEKYMLRRDGEDFDHMDINPKGDLLALSGPGLSMILDIQTGKLLAQTGEASQAGYSAWATGIRFLNDSEIISDTEDTVFKFNFVKGRKTVFPIRRFSKLFNSALSEDHSVITVSDYNENYSIATSDMTKLAQTRTSAIPNIGTQVVAYKIIPNNNDAYLFFAGRNNSSDYRIMDQHTLTPLEFNFLDTYGEMKSGKPVIKNISFSQDKYKAFF